MQPSQPFDFELNVTDECLGITVADVVHLFVSRHDEQLAEARRRKSLPSMSPISRQSAPTPLRNASRFARTEMSLPFTLG